MTVLLGRLHLQEIRSGIFEPDCSRGGRLPPGAKPLSEVSLARLIVEQCAYLCSLVDAAAIP